MTYTFIIPGEPCSKQRARSSNGRWYTPQKTVAYENYVRKCYADQVNICLEDAYISMEIDAYFKVPKSYSKSKIRQIFDGKYFPTNNDWDNVGKIVSDALNKIAYNDDRQIVDAHVKKRYCIEVGNEPRIEVKIKIIGGDYE